MQNVDISDAFVIFSVTVLLHNPYKRCMASIIARNLCYLQLKCNFSCTESFPSMLMLMLVMVLSHFLSQSAFTLAI